MLDLAKVEAGRLELDARAGRRSEAVAAESVAGLRPLADRKGIKLSRASSRRLDASTPTSGRLRQILYNLLSNAIKFTPDGGG